MQDPRHIRINNADDPDRLERFEKALKAAAADGNQVIRELIDAYCLFIEENEHSPTFPVRLVPAVGTRPKRKK